MGQSSEKAQEQKSPIGFWVGAVLMATVTGVGAYFSFNLARDGVFAAFFWALFLLGALFLFVERKRVAPKHLLVFLIILRTLTWLSPGPNFSDDIYRYVHEGRATQISLATPYSTPPKDITPSPDDGITSKVNHPEVPAAYPPFSQLINASITIVGDAIGFPIRTFLAVFWILEALVLLGLFALRRRFGYAFLIYGLHPLPILEVGINAHLDILGVFFMLIGVFAIVPTLRNAAPNEDRKRTFLWDLAGGICIGFACGVKPIAVLALIAAPLRIKKNIVVVCACVAGIVIPTLPYLMVDAPISKGLLEYSTRWESEPTGFALVSALVESPFQLRHDRGHYTHLHTQRSPMGVLIETAGKEVFKVGDIKPSNAPLLVDDRLFARAFIMAIFLMVIGGILISRAGPMQRCAYVFLSLWLLAPTVHPWYFLWVLPFAALSRSRAIWFWAAAAPLSYEVVLRVNAGGEWVESTWPRIISMALVLVGAFMDWRDQKPNA